MRLAITAFAVLATATAAMAAGPGFPSGEKGFTRADADKNGKLTLAEVSPAIEKRLFGFDANGDKSVTAAEIDARFKAAYDRRRDGLMAALDADKDGAITEAELSAYLALQFGKADADKDGGLTIEEARGWRLAMREEMRQSYRKKQEALPASP